MSAKSLSLLALAALVLSACGGGEPAPQSAAPTATPAAAPAAAPTATQPAAPTPTVASATVADEITRIPDIESGLDALASYRARFNFVFEGKDADGKDRKGTLEFVQEVTESGDQHTRVVGAGMGDDPADSGAFEMFNIAGVSYIYGTEDGTARCVSFSSGESSPDMAGLFKPGDILNGLDTARLVERGVTVNGISTNHYVLDENSINAGLFNSASGDIWIAQDGNFVVKYTGTATGRVIPFGNDDQEGTAAWDYQLEAINALTSIELPEECLAQKPADDIPVPASAAEKSQFGGMITFKTGDKPADVVAFYQTEMPKLGWMEGEAGEVGDIRTLNFTKGDRSLSIMISPEEGGGVNVLIMSKQGE